MHPFTDKAAEEFRMDLDLNGAKTGDTVTLCGTPWTVIGFVDRPAALLARLGHDPQPVNCRTHHTVVLGSDHAAEFKPKPDRAKELFHDLTDEDEAMDRSYADGFAEACRRIVSKGLLTEKGAKL